MRRAPFLLLALVLLLVAGCLGTPAPEGNAGTTPPAATTTPAATTPEAATPLATTPTASTPEAATTTPAATTPATATATATPTARPPPPPPPEPIPLPDGNRTFTLRSGAHQPAEATFLVNATTRALVFLDVRNAEPAPRGYGVTTLATGPNGSHQEDSGVVTEPGAAFSLRLDFAADETPVPIRVRVSSSVALVVEGRIDVDAEVPERGGSTVPWS